jgi:hypothetical protein
VKIYMFFLVLAGFRYPTQCSSVVSGFWPDYLHIFLPDRISAIQQDFAVVAGLGSRWDIQDVWKGTGTARTPGTFKCGPQFRDSARKAADAVALSCEPVKTS